MDLLTRAARSLGGLRGPERRMVGGTFGDSSIMPNSVMMGMGASGLVMTEAGALGISTVLNCVRVLFDDMKILPFRAYSGSRDGARVPIAYQPQIVAEPWGPDIPAHLGFAMLMASVKLRGAGYVQVVDTDRHGYPILLEPLHPDLVTPRRVNGAKRYVVKNLNGSQDEYGPDVVKQINGVMMPGALHGLDPVSYQRVMLGEAADVAQYGANFFKNGGSPGGVISVPGAGDRRKAREVKDVWESGHSGVVNSHRPAVLFGGATWTPLSMSNENAQFLGTRSFLREDICGWFGVPLQRIQAIVQHASQGGGKGLDTIDQGYATHTLLPVCVDIETVFTPMIPGKARTWAGFDFNGLLRASTMERAQIAQIHRLTGVRNRNEIRADEGWAPIEGPDGADYNLPFNTNTTVPPLIEPGVEDSAPTGDGTPGDDGSNDGGGA